VIFSGHVASLVVAPDGRGDSVEAIDVSRQAIGRQAVFSMPHLVASQAIVAHQDRHLPK
jgi:hypothetical protein